MGAEPVEPVPRKPRRTFTADQKAAILRRHHVDKVPISQLCEENGLQPSLFYYWQKQLFENAATALRPSVAAAPSKAPEVKVDALEKQVAKKDEIIAGVAEEHVKLKDTFGGALDGSGWAQVDVCDAGVDFTTERSERTGTPADRFIAWIGVQRGKFSAGSRSTARPTITTDAFPAITGSPRWGTQ